MHSWPLYIIVISLPAAASKKRARREAHRPRIFRNPTRAAQHSTTLSEGSRGMTAGDEMKTFALVDKKRVTESCNVSRIKVRKVRPRDNVLRNNRST